MLSDKFYKSAFIFKLLLWVVLFVTIQRILFFILFYNQLNDCAVFEYFKAFVIGFLTDTISLSYFLLPTWLALIFLNIHHHLTKRFALVWFVIGFTLWNILNLSDLGYFPITKKRMGAEILDILPEVPALLSAYLATYWYLFVILILYVLFTFYFFKKQLQSYQVKNNTLTYKGLNILILLFGFFTTLRGGYGIRPFMPFDIPSIVEPKLQWLASNTPFQFIHTLENKNIPTETFFEESLAEKTIQYQKQFQSNGFEKKNILFIILESFCSERVGFFNPNIKQYTPFMDSLYAVSRTYMYGMANGRMTIDALPSVLSGVPSLMEKNYCYSNYSNHPIKGIGTLLQAEGYTTAFFYGGLKSTFGFENFMNINFTKNYYDQRDYNANYENIGWGVDDHLYLPFVAQQLNNLPQPFCASLLTLSLHHPFPIPEPYKAKLDTIKDPVLKSMRYTDIALQQFFYQIQHQSWFKNAIIAICADHTSGGFGHYQNNSINEFAIPISFYAVGDTVFNKPQVQSISQIDMYPTILDYLGYPKSFGSMGKSALSDTTHVTIQFAGNGIYHVFDFPYVIDFDKNRNEILSFHKFNSDRTITALDVNGSEKVKADFLFNYGKAFIQVFSYKINKNEF